MPVVRDIAAQKAYAGIADERGVPYETARLDFEQRLAPDDNNVLEGAEIAFIAGVLPCAYFEKGRAACLTRILHASLSPTRLCSILRCAL